MAYRKKTYKKKYAPKKKRMIKRRRKTFAAKRKGNAMLKAPASRTVTFPCRGCPIMKLQNNGGGVQNYQVIGAICLINNAVGSMSTAPCLYGQTMSLYRTQAAWNVFGQQSLLYDEFRITGVKAKFVFPSGGTFGGNNFIALELYYDPNSIAWGQNATYNAIETCSNYQYIPITVNNTTISRYWDCKPILKKQGLGWCSTKDVPGYLGGGGFTYYGQLAAGTVPSIGWRITTIGLNSVDQIMGQIELTYYCQFRGLNYGGTITPGAFEQVKTVETQVTTSMDVPFVNGN